MQPIFMLIGPPAVGKSSTSRALAAAFPKSLYIPVDDLRMMVVSGLALPSAKWSSELAAQIALARESVTHMALSYARAGFAVVIDDFWDPNHAADYAALFASAPVGKVVLYPQQQEAHARNFKRSGGSPDREYIDEGIRIVYDQLNPRLAQLAREGWRVLDTTTLSVEETVQQILQSGNFGADAARGFGR